MAATSIHAATTIITTTATSIISRQVFSENQICQIIYWLKYNLGEEEAGVREREHFKRGTTTIK